MAVILSKTDYILYRECPKNVWYKIHKPDIYFKLELSEFEKKIIETGNEVELVARKIFSDGILVEGRGEEAQKFTQELIKKKTLTIFQPVFFKDNFLAAVDILKYDKETDSYRIIEIKASNSIDEKKHYYDLAFQVNLLRRFGLKIAVINLMHLNPDYVREGELDLNKLFKTDDVSYEVEEIQKSIGVEMDTALEYLSQKEEPKGFCCCVYKGRSAHCTTFRHSNPDIPDYGVHDIARIGNSKKKLRELIDSGIFHIHKVPEDMKLSEAQKNQINAHISDKPIINLHKIAKELEKIIFPIYFLDYETFPSAIPLYDGYSPYQQVPFQYSLHVIDAPDSEAKHFEFLHEKNSDPSREFVNSLKSHIGDKGSVLVWSKKFECGRNKELAGRVPDGKTFMESINDRAYDLMDIFAKQYHVHKDFKGSASIKKILPVLVPDLSYEKLVIREGGAAITAWGRLIDKKTTADEKEEIKKDMLEYCKMDTYAMVRIWQELNKL